MTIMITSLRRGTRDRVRVLPTLSRATTSRQLGITLSRFLSINQHWLPFTKWAIHLYREAAAFFPARLLPNLMFLLPRVHPTPPRQILQKPSSCMRRVQKLASTSPLGPLARQKLKSPKSPSHPIQFWLRNKTPVPLRRQRNL